MTFVEAFRNADPDAVPAEIVRGARPEDATWTADTLGLPERMQGVGPLVSVVVPTYRDAQYLPDALESVGAQSYQNLELIIVEQPDSSDNEWIEQLASERDWIIYLSRKPAGPSPARNDGVEAASGEYVAFLDADDYWHPDKLQRQVDALEDGHNVVYSDAYLVKYDHAEPTVAHLKLAPEGPETTPRAYLEHGAISMSSLVFRRSELLARPFDESLAAAEDLLLCIEFFRSHQPVRVPEPLCVWRVRPDSLTDDNNRMYRDKVAAIDQLEACYPDLKDAIDERRSLVELNRGQELLKRDEKREARRKLKASFELSNGNYRALGLYLASYVPLRGETTVELLRALQDPLNSGSGQHLSIRGDVELDAGE